MPTDLIHDTHLHHSLGGVGPELCQRGQVCRVHLARRQCAVAEPLNQLRAHRRLAVPYLHAVPA